MSFVDQEDVFSVVENYLRDVVAELSKKTIMDSRFYSMSYADAMEKYGSDKPDLRYGLELVDVIDIFARSTNGIFSGIAADKEKNRIKAIRVPN
jgi:aspartyl-tRNA synthetase